MYQIHLLNTRCTDTAGIRSAIPIGKAIIDSDWLRTIDSHGNVTSSAEESYSLFSIKTVLKHTLQLANDRRQSWLATNDR